MKISRVQRDTAVAKIIGIWLYLPRADGLDHDPADPPWSVVGSWPTGNPESVLHRDWAIESKPHKPGAATTTRMVSLVGLGVNGDSLRVFIYARQEIDHGLAFFSLLANMIFSGVTRRAGLPLAAVLAASISVPASAATNLVKNGDFEDSTANNTALNPTSAGGIGQIQLGSPTSPDEALLVTLAEWTKSQVTPGDGSKGFAFVINADADYRIVGAAYPNQGGGFPSIFSNDKSTNIFLWGPDYGPDPQSNGFSGPPSSTATNKFVGIDGDYGASILSQAITGFDPAKQYVLSYDYAGAQETGEMGQTEQQWKVNLGPLNFSPTKWINDSKGFTAWKTYTSTPFSGAGLDGALLSFESWGRAVVSGSLPPFLLLDNVKIMDTTNPPGPTVPGPLPVLGAGMALGWTRRLRRRVVKSRFSAQG